MAAQGYALRPVRLTDLPALKRWRSLPHVQAHLRHPIPPTWREHLRWWWRIRKHGDPTCRVWAVTHKGRLTGQAGLYYRMADGAEVSLLVMHPGTNAESMGGEMDVLGQLLVPAARAWGIRELWAEVLRTAPIWRHLVFGIREGWRQTFADATSTFYRMTLK